MNVIAKPAAPPLSETDEHAWLLAQAAALREGRLHDLDRDSLAEYLEAMGRRDIRELESRLTVLLAHLLKIAFQPERHSRSWLLTVLEQQRELRNFLRDSPSLASRREVFLAEVYPGAVREAASETGLPRTAFPRVPPWTVDAALAFEPPEPPERHA